MRRLAFVGLLFSTSVAAAPWKLDADFDGTKLPIELEASGKLKIGADSVTIGTGVTRATISAARVGAKNTVVVDAAMASGEEAIVLQQGARGWETIARTPVGPVGADGEYSVEVSATAAGVVRHQSRPGWRRCDGKPALLFAEGLEGGKFHALAKLPTLMPEGAPIVAAHADGATPAVPAVFRARVASHEAHATDAGALAIPSELDDGKPATAWREDLAGDGEGQFFTFQPRIKGAKATQLRVVAAGKTYNRPKRLGVVWAGGATHVDVPEIGGDAFVVDLPQPIDGCVSVVLESTWGPANGTTAIAELEVYADGERTGGGDAILAGVVAAGADGERAAAQELARRGATGVAALDAELAKTNDAGARSRLVRALIGVKDPAAAPALARAIAQRSVQDKDLVDAVTALGAIGGGQQLAELAAEENLPTDARIGAVHALAASDAKLALGLAGTGPRALRHEVIATLSKVPVATLVPAAQAAQAPAAAGDLWRATTRRAHATPDERGAALAAMTAALATSSDYERRYRLVEGLATLGDAPALASLESLLKSLPADGSTAAYGQVIAKALGDEPRADALPLALSLAQDRDAGVRYAALGTLAVAGVSSDAAAIDQAMSRVLASDGWPELRRRAAQVLGGRCARADAAKALGSAFGRDAEVAVRGDALASLVDCHATGVADLLVRTWESDKQPLELRQRAVDLAVVLGDHTLADKLVKELGHWRGAALESGEALALAQNAAYAVGRLAPPNAASALTSAVQDGSFPEITAAAATGLGLLGKSCPASAKALLKDLAQSEDERVAPAAARAAAICGK